MSSWRSFCLIPLLFTAPLLAHQQPMSSVIADIGPASVSLSIHLPLPELELAFGRNVTRTPLQQWRAALSDYVVLHLHPRTTAGAGWQVRITNAAVSDAVQAQSGPFREVVLTAELLPPAGADVRNFMLGYDVILHQVVTHKALVSVRSDWSGGQLESTQAGVIAVDTETGRIAPLAIKLGQGGWWQGFRGMFLLGMEHIREGTDHLLFLLVLLLPATLTVAAGRWHSFVGARYSVDRLLRIVTAFTIGHSLTLLAGALHWLSLPSQTVEILIAVSVLITAIHAVYPLFPGSEARVAAGFGLVHGLAFAGVLTGMKMTGPQLALSILGFNLGIELMQILVIATCVPWLILLSTTPAHRLLRIAGAALAAVAALGWIASRSTGQSNPIDRVMSAAPAFAPVGFALLAVLALGFRMPRVRLPIPVSTIASLTMSALLVGYSLTGLRAQDFRLPVVAPLLAGNVTAQPRLSGVSDVVAKALAFKALLTPAQQQVLEQSYTQTLARRWSNLPCAATCRNGIQLGSLNAEQLAAALEVIRAAAGTTPNEGSDEFNQIRLADTLLASSGGAGGPGNFSYGQGFYYLAFLNTPSTSGAWMLQYGGHHYGANIAFNMGRVVGTTPLFEALEPLTFTVSGTTYSPLVQERTALANMLASLTAAQLASARLSQTFSDTTMSPGESNGGNGNFPATKVGVPVASLSAAQKLLVLEAMKPWVRDMDDTVATNLLAIYQNELDGTYIAYTGAGVSGDAASFLAANTNYARIDGPSVWIEFACQGGIIFRDQIHYHTVWRDHARDYGRDLSLTVPLDSAAAGAVTAVSSASYAAGTLAPGAIATLFGTSLATSAATAPGAWPTTLNGIQVRITDSAGAAQNAPVYYVSPTQISFQLPANLASGVAAIAVLRDGVTVGQGSAVVEQVAPGLFSANATGQGVAAAVALRVRADGTQISEPLIQFNAATNRFEAAPLAFGDATEQLYLLAFGTGFRNRSSLSAVSATIGGVTATVAYAGAQGTLAGLDQANILIPRSLAGRGEVSVALTVDGKPANTVTITLR